tara:strand:- start:785 stop:931 length:147 start_codon:yes stop_codon:yes gene_type:complete
MKRVKVCMSLMPDKSAFSNAGCTDSTADKYDINAIDDDGLVNKKLIFQ